jgi:hypothetical protein
MNRIVLPGTLVLALLTAGSVFLGLPKIVLIAVMVGLWLALTVAISFVGDQRFGRAFGGAETRPPSADDLSQPSLTIGRAILVGELVINVLVLALLVGIIAAVGPAVQYAMGYDGVGRAPALPALMAVVLAFVGAWSWWAIVTPRWLLWEMRRVADPRALKGAAVGSILWPDRGWGRRFNRTQLRSAAMRNEETALLSLTTKDAG